MTRSVILSEAHRAKSKDPSPGIDVSGVFFLPIDKRFFIIYIKKC